MAEAQAMKAHPSGNGGSYMTNFYKVRIKNSLELLPLLN